MVTLLYRHYISGRVQLSLYGAGRTGTGKVQVLIVFFFGMGPRKIGRCNRSGIGSRAGAAAGFIFSFGNIYQLLLGSALNHLYTDKDRSLSAVPWSY
jgi:hypothetical protein